MKDKMTRTPITSKAIRSIGYDPATETMEIEFQGGSCHAFSGVSAESHHKFMESESKGAHFAASIKPHHESRKLHEDKSSH